MTEKEELEYYRESIKELVDVLKTLTHRNSQVIGTKDIFLKALREILAHTYNPGAHKRVRNDN